MLQFVINTGSMEIFLIIYVADLLQFSKGESSNAKEEIDFHV
jgi:hypothetical protein